MRLRQPDFAVAHVIEIALRFKKAPPNERLHSSRIKTVGNILEPVGTVAHHSCTHNSCDFSPSITAIGEQALVDRRQVIGRQLLDDRFLLRSQRKIGFEFVKCQRNTSKNRESASGRFGSVAVVQADNTQTAAIGRIPAPRRLAEYSRLL